MLTLTLDALKENRKGFSLLRHKRRVQYVSAMEEQNSYTKASCQDKLCFVIYTTHRSRFETESKMKNKPVKDNLPRKLLSSCESENWDDFIKKCQEQPQIFCWVSSYGQNLLHFLCQRRPSVETVRSLLLVVPDALMKQDADGCLPIHVAMTNGTSHKALTALIEAAPQSVKVTNKWGYCAFDWILERCLYELSCDSDPAFRQAIWNTVEALIRAVVGERTHSHTTILHLVTEFKCSLRLLQEILDEFPMMTTFRDEKGRVPLANAAAAPTQVVSTQFVRLLTLYNPNMLVERDNRGRLPLHLAIDCDREWERELKYMVECNPECIRIQDGLTGLYPFMMLSSKSSISLLDLNEAMSFCPDVFNEWS